MYAHRASPDNDLEYLLKLWSFKMCIQNENYHPTTINMNRPLGYKKLEYGLSLKIK